MLPRHNDLIAIDLFAGAGGLSLGLIQSGFKVIAASDNDHIAVSTYEKNIGKHVLETSIEELSAKDVMSFAGIGRGDCTLVAGGPPCQGFSVQRRGTRKDPRNSLVLQYIRLVTELRPRFFLMENVKGLLSKHGKPYLDQVIKQTESYGYICHISTLDAADYGVPQFRKRAFLVGEHLNSSRTAKYAFPNALNLPPKTVREAIGDLPSPPQDGSSHPDFPNHYREIHLSAVNIERIKHVPPGGGREYIPEYLQLDCHKNNPKHRHLDVYGRLAWDTPSVTLTARFDSFTRGRFGHPIENRSITLREGARLQSFPDHFEFKGNRGEGARQIGNAVPPELARHLGNSIVRIL